MVERKDGFFATGNEREHFVRPNLDTEGIQHVEL
jgi:hypothetical protein